MLSTSTNTQEGDYRNFGAAQISGLWQMKFVELPAGWRCHPEHILKHCPPQSEAEHRLWSALCGKAVRDQQEEVSAEIGFLVQETRLPEAEILEVLQRWQEAGGAFPKTEG